MRIVGYAIALMLLAATCAAQERAPSETELRGYTACFARALGVTPRWALTIVVANDTTRLNDYGETKVDPTALNADVWYNAVAITRAGADVRTIALHEVVHIAIGELTWPGWRAMPELTLIENEKLVRQIVRWPNWRGVCEKPTP